MYTEDLVVQLACEQSECVPNNTMPSLLRLRPRPLSFDVLVLDISVGLLSIL